MSLILYILLAAVNIFYILAIVNLILNLLIYFKFVDLNNAYIKKADDFMDGCLYRIYFEIRKHVPLVGGVDLSPLIFILFLSACRKILISLL